MNPDLEKYQGDLLAFRARGAEYGYFFGLHGPGKVAVLRRDHEDGLLAEAEVLRTVDSNPHPYGMAGVGKLAPGRTRFLLLAVVETA